MAFTLDTIRHFLQQDLASPDNILPILEGPAFAPDLLLGCAAGDDPLFAQFRSDISPDYLLPGDWMALAGVEAAPGELSVVSWALPQTDETRAAQAEETSRPARRWSANRAFGQGYQNRMCRRLVDELTGQGIPAVCPMIRPEFRQLTSPRFGFASNWSERHTAYACGLGIYEPYRRRGYATEAILLLLRFYFLELRMHKCNAGAYSFNEASIGLHRSLGQYPLALSGNAHNVNLIDFMGNRGDQ